MLDLKNIGSAIAQIAEEKGIPKEKIIETIELALAAAYKREHGKKGEVVRASFDLDKGALSFAQLKLVVDESMLRQEGDEEESLDALDAGERKVRFHPDRHIMLEDARGIKPGVLTGEEISFPLEVHTEFGRIAAQTAKQVILQKIHEAERELIFDEYKNKEGEVVSGIIQRIEGRTVFIDLGKTIGVMLPDETVAVERYFPGARMKFYVLSVDESSRGSSVLLSRSYPKFVSKLFAAEVPEISEGIVEIKSIAREPGIRSKIAVMSNDEAVDPIGACVGQRGTRVNAVTAELGGEKIDIIEWSDDPNEFLTHALSPAKVVNVEIRPHHEARVYVPADQLSLAIGRQGQNVRLAARLTSWKIEIRSSLRPEEIVEGGVAESAANALSETTPVLATTEPETGLKTLLPENTAESFSRVGENELGVSSNDKVENAKSATLTESIEQILGKAVARKLAGVGIDSLEKLKNMPQDELLLIKGIGPKAIEKIKNLN